MFSKAIREKYSCKRRRDYVTGFAVIFFVLVVFFELYVVIWMPVQLQQKNMLAEHTAREQLLRNFDSMRHACRSLHNRNRGFAKGEVFLTLHVLDLYAIYLRGHADKMDIHEIGELQRTLGRFQALITSWQKGKYCFRKLDFDLDPALSALEKKNGL